VSTRDLRRLHRRSGKDEGSMKMKHVSDRYANFDDGTCWPLPESVGDDHDRTAYALRYRQELTWEQRIYASDVIGAFEALIARPAKRRQEIVMAIREAIEQRDGE
jgi:hypothetical protein